MAGGRAVAVALVTLAGCSPGATQPAPDDVPRSPSASASASAVPDDAPPSQAPPGPLETYLGYTDELDSPETIAARITWRENLTAACMAEQGFDYTPVVPAVGDIELEDGPIPGTAEFVERYGYGIWTQPSSSGGYHWARGVDPNEALVEAMSDAAREAYVLALSGPVISESADGSVMREGGCASTADEPTSGEVEYLVEVRREAMAFLETIDQDPRFAEVHAAWASCLADAGFADRSPGAARQRVEAEFLEALVDGAPPAPDVVSAGAAEERTLAIADLECRDTTDWSARHRALELEVQQEYVDAHLDDLEALVAAMEPRASD